MIHVSSLRERFEEVVPGLAGVCISCRIEHDGEDVEKVAAEGEDEKKDGKTFDRSTCKLRGVRIKMDLESGSLTFIQIWGRRDVR